MDVPLPNELWLETFSFLPRKTLISLNSTSRLFHQLSRPLVFANLDFHPFQISDDFSAGLPIQRFSSQGEIDRNIRRLEFWASEEIAPFVRECTFSALRRREDPVGVFTAFFDFLPNFSNMQELACFIVDFDQAGVTALCSLSNLARLQLTGCSLQGDVDATSLLRTKSIFFVQAGAVDRLRASGAHRWATLLEKDTLVELTIPSAPSSTIFIEGAASSCYPNLHTLSIGTLWWTQLSILVNFPALRHLRVASCPPYSDKIDAARILFPLLETYAGPHEVLLFLDLKALPKTLSINPCDPNLLLERFGRGGHPALRGVEQLLVSLHHLHFDLLPRMFASGKSFPVLRDFRMKIYRAYEPVEEEPPEPEMHTLETFFSGLAAVSPFPASIEKVYLAWYTDSAPLTLEVAQAVKTTLCAVQQALKCVWLVAPAFQYLWVGTGGTQQEFVRTTEGVNDRNSRTGLAFSFPDLNDPFVGRYNGA